MFPIRSVQIDYEEDNWGNQFSRKLAGQLSSALEAVDIEI
jgi:hypothetical protein